MHPDHGGLASAVLPAQDMPKPAKELARFDRLIGDWEGSGTAAMGPGTARAPWTATISYQKVLGGHFIMDTTIVTLGPPGSPRMEFRGYMGWDRENGRYMLHSCGNNGKSKTVEMAWVDADTMVMPHTGWNQGQIGATREIVRLTKSGGLEIQIDAAAGASPFFTTVKGSFKKKTRSPTAQASKTRGEHVAGLLDKGTPGMTPVASEMETLSKLLGSWSITGTMMEKPGGPKIPISGTETLVTVFGGHAVMATFASNPMPNGFVYQAHAFFTWNQRLKCFDLFDLNNMGEAGESKGWWLGDNLFVATNAAFTRGKPTVMRTTLKINKDGSMLGAADGTIGDSAPLRTFEATYKRKP